MARFGRGFPVPIQSIQPRVTAAPSANITEDPSAPAAVTSTTTTVTTASFTPAANSLLVAVSIAGNNTGSGTITTTVTDSLGSTWTRVARASAAGGGCVDIYLL